MNPSSVETPRPGQHGEGFQLNFTWLPSSSSFVEVVFLYPWAVVFRRLGLFGFVEMLVFVAILAVGLLYIIKKGALESA